MGYKVSFGDITIYHCGDSTVYEGQAEKVGTVDIAMLPVNGRSFYKLKANCIGNMTFQEAADLAGELNLQTVIPGHWDMFADNPGDPGAFADYLDAKYPGHVREIQPEYLKPIILYADP